MKLDVASRWMIRTCVIAALLLPNDLIAAPPNADRGSGALSRKETQRLTRLLASERPSHQIVAQRILSQHPRTKYQCLPELIKTANRWADDFSVTETPPVFWTNLVDVIVSTGRPVAWEFVCDLVKHPNPNVQFIAVEQLGTNGVPGTIAALGAAVNSDGFDRYYAMRSAVCRAFWKIGTPPAIERLTEVHGEVDGQLRVDIEGWLDTVTASWFDDERQFVLWHDRYRRHRSKPNGDSRSIRMVSFDSANNVSSGGLDVAASRPRGTDDDVRVIRFETLSSGSIRKETLRFSPPHYYGIPIVAKRLLFVVDRSGSMRMRVPGTGANRWQLATREFIRAIRSLDGDCEFGVLAFGDDVRLWKSSLVPASPKNVESAIGFVNRLDPKGWTNTHAALVQGMNFDAANEAIYLLTDGAPRRGLIRGCGAIVTDVVHRNRFRHQRVHTIGLGVGGQTRRFLADLAKRTEAEFRSVE